ncbi:MAG: molybdopterin cofactor-binding domain-containing protein [Cyclobacteriaceae bacterium]
MKNTLDRRSFLKLSVSAGGALVAGFYFQSCNETKVTATEHVFSPLIKIDTDGWVTLVAKNPEIGQGIKTALPMILAEELGANWEKVRVDQADFDAIYQDQWAGGSYAIILNWDEMRKAAATVRQVLIEAASKRMKVPASDLTAVNSRVVHAGSGSSLAFEELIEEVSKIPLPEEAEFKSMDSFEILGKSIPQVDLEKLVRGETAFSIDIKLPDMLYATVVKNPVFEGGVVSWDDAETKSVNGVLNVIKLDNEEYGGRLVEANSPNFVNGVGVIATTTWAALKGAEKLKVQWDNSGTRRENQKEILEKFETQLRKTTIERRDGSIENARRNAADYMEAIYEVPFLAHATMEPMNCTVDFRTDKCEVWAPTQNPEALQNGLIKLFGLQPEQIKIHMPRIGGGFGRRYYVDYAMDAAVLSKKLGKPVKLTWTREEDIKHDWYRSASIQQIGASLDAEGNVIGWRYVVANASRKTSLGREGNPAGTEIDEYDFPAGLVSNLQFEYGQVLSDVPLGQWRAVAQSANAFPVHSFLDELAVKYKMDPIDYFLRFLGPARMVPIVDDYELDLARLIDVVNQVRAMSNWDSPLPAGQGRGFAAHKNSGSYIAEVVTVKMIGTEKVKILKVDAVVDCGIVINYSGAKAQVEGGIMEGLCAALYGEITVKDGAAMQSNFHDYRWMRIGEAPEVNIEFVKNKMPPRGLGEPPLPPAAPALANAIFAASGKRLRKLPLLKQL